MDFVIHLNKEDSLKRTTLMIKNIPNKYTKKMLLKEIETAFSDKYDFFYLPIDFNNNCNMGYAFINFKHVDEVKKFHRDFHC